MDWVGWVIGTVGVLATLITFYLFDRKATGARREKIKGARKEVEGILINEFANDEQALQRPAVEALLNNKYRECNIASLTDTELPLIVDDLITTFVENIFITPEKRQLLIDKALALKENFGKRVSSLDEALDDWEQSSVSNIVLQLVGLGMLVMVFGVIVVLLSAYVNAIFLHQVPDSTSLLLQFGMFVVAGIFLVLVQFGKLKRRREIDSNQLRRVLEDSAIEALTNSFPNVRIERNAIIGSEGHINQVDLVLISNGTRVPIEIKHGLVNSDNIEQITGIMRQMESKRSFLITSSRVADTVKELARQRGIILLENVASEADIVAGLKNTSLFG